MVLSTSRHYDAIKVRRPEVPVMSLRSKRQNEARGRYWSDHEASSSWKEETHSGGGMSKP